MQKAYLDLCEREMLFYGINQLSESIVFLDNSKFKAY